MGKRALFAWFLLLAIPLCMEEVNAQSQSTASAVSAKVTLWDGKSVALSDIVRVAITTKFGGVRPYMALEAFRDLRFKTEAGSREHVGFSSIRRAEFGKEPVPARNPEEQTLRLTMADGSVRQGYVGLTLEETTEGFQDGDDVSMERLKVALVQLREVKSIEFAGAR